MRGRRGTLDTPAWSETLRRRSGRKIVKDRLRRWALLTLAWMCLTVAALSLVIPFLPTTVPVIVGLLILSTEYAWAHRTLERWKVRWPKFAAVVDKVEAKTAHWIGRRTTESPQG